MTECRSQTQFLFLSIKDITDVKHKKIKLFGKSTLLRLDYNDYVEETKISMMDDLENVDWYNHCVVDFNPNRTVQRMLT